MKWCCKRVEDFVVEGATSSIASPVLPLMISLETEEVDDCIANIFSHNAHLHFSVAEKTKISQKLGTLNFLHNDFEFHCALME